MLEALAALSAAGGNALVSAMVTDGWEGVRARFARLLGHGDKTKVAAAAAELDESRAVLAGLSGGDLQKAQAEQEVVWRTRLGELLKRHPDAEPEIRALVTEVRAQVVGAAGHVEQHVTGSGQAQQAVLGTGVQNVSFGGQGDPSRR
jgi:hypothetical protein